ncbi:hypothetical protein BXZ70DRAFT_907033 [Cristinia sonorae]|uniref:Uncharacterized protein n=1 Tax=Cristinia sonorae TaxID=1940300 RepID=A0A8K0UR87_9AGAR|nr:hypothetical protein BXZ70DRAFT_907033 [Cristinia sonorae]
MRRDTEPVQAAEFAVVYTAASGEVCAPKSAVRLAGHAARYRAGTGGRICGGVYCGERRGVRAKISSEIGRTCGKIQSQYRRRDLWWSIPPVAKISGEIGGTCGEI